MGALFPFSLPSLLLTALCMVQTNPGADGAARIRYKGTNFDSFTIDPRRENLHFLFTDDKGRRFGSIEAVRDYLKGKSRKLIFATNGGMFTPLLEPNGLFIANGLTVFPLDLGDAMGNFYLKPNGVFYVTEDGAGIVRSEHFDPSLDYVRFATQSGPMLITNGKIHPAFKPKSDSKHIRSGVGITADGRVVFAISNTPVNFYHFALFFRKRMGCYNALFLDGTVSKMYLPYLNRYELGGDFAVVIAVSR